jgi:acyl-CoA thioesterase YciA
MLDLHRLDERSLADLGINRGDFPAILAGTYVRGGQADWPARAQSDKPRGELASRTLAMPADANPSGTIFGGWVMALMDAAGAMSATQIADGRVVTASVSQITFLNPLQVGDSVCCYTEIARIGKTSLTLNVEVWVLREGRGDRIKVTHAEFTFVAVDAAGKPRRLPRLGPVS